MAHEAGERAPKAGRYRCSGTAKKPCMKTIVVAEREVLPLCSACGSRRSLWFLVERAPRLESITPPAPLSTDAPAKQERTGVGA